MSTHELENKCRELRQLQELIEEAQAEAEAIKSSIKQHMGEQEEVRVGKYHVIWKAVTSAKIDTAAFKSAMPELAKTFTKESTVRRFVMT